MSQDYPRLKAELATLRRILPHFTKAARTRWERDHWCVECQPKPGAWRPATGLPRDPHQPAAVTPEEEK